MIHAQYTLRSLFVVTTILALALGWIPWKRRELALRREEMREVHKVIEANVFFPDELGSCPPPGPAWLRYWLGDDAFAEPEVDCFHTRGNLRLLQQYPRLKWLHMIPGSVHDMKELSPLAELRHLTRLELPGDYFDDDALPYVARLAGLEELNLRCALISDAGLRQLVPLQSLRVLRVGWRSDDSDIPEITDAGMKSIAELSSLEELDIGCCHVSDQGVKLLRRLPRLRTLDLTLNPITDATLEEVKRFPRLEQLDLTETNLTPAKVSEFQKSCPRIKIVSRLFFSK